MENRFLEMDAYLKQISNKNNKRSIRTNLRSSAQSNNSPYVKSFGAVNYQVPGLVSPLRQRSSRVCWATVATMMVMWKRQQSIPIPTVLGSIGNMYVTKFNNNEWLLPAEKIPFLNAAGFQFEYPQSHSIEGWERLLRNYGPIWVTTDEDPTIGFAIHARIISAIQGDGTPENTYLTIIDPGTGTQYREKVADFLVKYEQEARDSGASWSGRIQVVHWPAGAGVAQSFTNERTQTWSLSQQGVDLIKEFEGFRANMYNDAAGHCTIGYGTLLHQGNCNGSASEQPYTNGITTEQATQLLLQRANEFQRMINDRVTVELNQNQYDSLVSFAYNIGSGAFQQSTLLRVLNLGQYDAVPTEMKKWTKATVDGRKVDLPGLVTRRNREANLFTTPVSTSQSFTVYPVSSAPSTMNYSKPFYDTGEHAILGEFINNAISGPLATVYPLLPTTTYSINAVPFTYGQIMTLGDFYNTYNDCKTASVTELNGLKALIVRSENHYKNSILSIGGAVGDVSNNEWSRLIGQRYIDLALVNNSHFSPPPAGTATLRSNNKLTWEQNHASAIQTARAGIDSDVFNVAYPMNAFGDHFLTDAFSAGHLINKELVMNRFIANVMTNGSVNSAGDRMFERIADAALAIPEINRKLGKFEIIHWFRNYDLNNTGWFVPEVFYRVLKGVMEDTASGGTQKIANLAVKAVHDYLNNYSANGVKGVPVVNNKGNRWNLTGDGTLNLDNIRIIQLAVKQSVENIEDSVRNPSTPVATLCQKVWDYVPSLSNPDTVRIVNDAINTFTNPSSDALIRKAVELIGSELDTLLNELLRAGKIQCINNHSARTVDECR